MHDDKYKASMIMRYGRFDDEFIITITKNKDEPVLDQIKHSESTGRNCTKQNHKTKTSFARKISNTKPRPQHVPIMHQLEIIKATTQKATLFKFWYQDSTNVPLSKLHTL